MFEKKKIGQVNLSEFCIILQKLSHVFILYMLCSSFSFDSASSRKIEMEFFSPSEFIIKNEGHIVLTAALCC